MRRVTRPNHSRPNYHSYDLMLPKGQMRKLYCAQDWNADHVLSLVDDTEIQMVHTYFTIVKDSLFIKSCNRKDDLKRWIP